MSADAGPVPVALPAPRLMPEVLHFLATRRSVKVIHLAEPGPDQGALDALLALALRVPDHGKLGPVRFVVLEGQARHDFGAAWAGILAARDPAMTADALATERARLARAPCVVAVISTAAPHAKIPVWEQELVAGAVGLQLLMAAHASGWGACWLTGPLAQDPDAARLQGVAAGERIAGFFHIGTATQTQPERERPDLAARVTRWSAPA
jgi:nitroreductase